MFRNVSVSIFVIVLFVSASELRAQRILPFPTHESFAASAEAQRYVAAAMELAQSDLIEEANSYCSATGPRRPALNREADGGAPLEDYQLEPIKVFENLYYVGFNDVGAWVIPTSDGIILMDTLNSTAEARDVLVPGIEKIGLDPAQIKHIIIGHGHNDHVGGAAYLQETYGAQVHITEADWDLSFSSETADRPRPIKDRVVTDGQELTLGDTTLTLVLTPGHTDGTLAVLAPVNHLGRTHTIFIFSGTWMTSQESRLVFEHVFDDFGRPMGAESAISGHPGILVNKIEYWDQLGREYPTGPHPLLLGKERFDRYMSIMLECGSARLAAMEDSPDRMTRP
ncbi:MAG: MBL fold metallo-hydrolase [Gammaproteobacteria bacterium]|jgi:metallo-beta-lactamase class B|nr:MBL fold metallo-hydrolase [Gammaproteobacteria bacterium]|tara:strand:- start:164 stop:1183 length:1020 start_codon:yes stop_codon:yes gene_type:complete